MEKCKISYEYINNEQSNEINDYLSEDVNDESIIILMTTIKSDILNYLNK